MKTKTRKQSTRTSGADYETLLLLKERFGSYENVAAALRPHPGFATVNRTTIIRWMELARTNKRLPPRAVGAVQILCNPRREGPNIVSAEALINLLHGAEKLYQDSSRLRHDLTKHRARVKTIITGLKALLR